MCVKRLPVQRRQFQSTMEMVAPSGADPEPWIRILIIKVGSVWKDTNPDKGLKN